MAYIWRAEKVSKLVIYLNEQNIHTASMQTTSANASLQPQNYEFNTDQIELSPENFNIFEV